MSDNTEFGPEDMEDTGIPADNSALSSETPLGETGAGDNPDADGMLENGFDIATFNGGMLEGVEGFDASRALTEGIPGETIEIDADMAAIPDAGDLEFDLPESVCGRDDRVRVTATSSIPWRMICQLLITRSDGASVRGTGWMVGPRTVITAGHCVYSRSTKGWARSIQVIPGMNGSSRPFGTVTAKSFRSVKGWVNSGKVSHDYGAIILPSTLGNSTGYFGYASLSTSSLKNLLVNSSGYSGDKPFGTQWYNAGRVTKVETQRLHYMIDTFGGNSGGPIWRYSNGQRHVVGIHNYGGCPNKATRINKAVFDNIKAWKAL